jgi:hypothetical protein
MRRIRISAGITRWVVYAVAAAGLAATARLAIAPPRASAPAHAPVERRDLAAEGFAAYLARAYLTFDGQRPGVHRERLAPFVGDALDPDLGLRAPPGSRERVRWTQVVQSRPADDGSRVYTVAAQTDRAGLLYLSVDVERDKHRVLRLDGYPALVGAPLAAPAGAASGSEMRDVADGSLRATCQRALRNYLARAADNLDADLTPGAAVALPGLALSMRRLTALQWAADRRSVFATVDAVDGDGVTYELRYELDVRRVDARWEIAAIQTDPTT